MMSTTQHFVVLCFVVISLQIFTQSCNGQLLSGSGSGSGSGDSNNDVTPTSTLTTATSTATSTPTTTPTNPDPTCSRAVGQVIIRIAGVYNDTILSTLCTVIISTANQFCFPQFLTTCGLSAADSAVRYVIVDCQACLISSTLTKRTPEFTIQLYIRQPANSSSSGSVLPLSALVTITRTAAPIFEANTGLQVLEISTISPSNGSNNGRLIAIIVGSVVGGVALIVAVIIVCICLVVLIFAKKSKRRRVVPTEAAPLTKHTNTSTNSLASQTSNNETISNTAAHLTHY